MNLAIVNPSRALAEFVVDLSSRKIPESVRHEAKRSLINYFAVGLAGCRDKTINTAFDVYRMFAAEGPASVFGRKDRVDVLTAAAINAMGANVFDFDDTHTPTIIHPTAPVAAALFSLSQAYPVNGVTFLTAFLAGVEVQCRLGNAISPYHYSRGWHITSTCAVVGVAAAVGHVLGLGVQQMLWAFGSAVNQSCGLVECLGTASKSTSVGNAARNGLLSAFLARQGFDGPADPLSGLRGFIRVYGDGADPQKLVEDLGSTWEINQNTYKPYPCGVVLNPVIDACIELSQNPEFRQRSLQDLKRIVLTGHPLLRQRTDRPNIRTGRESQVCAQHAVPIVLMQGKAGLEEFSDEAVSDAEVRALGALVSFEDDHAYSVDAATVRLEFSDSTVLRQHVDNAKGSVANPLSDADLEKKLHALCSFSRQECDAASLARDVWSMDTLDDVSQLMRHVS